MNEKVKEYLNKQDKIITEDREKTLITLGLTEKEYAPNNENRESYRYPKYDYSNGERKYYREVAMTVTDEEYLLILEKAKQVKDIKAKEDIEKQKEKNKSSHKTVKKWIPIFEKPKDEWASYGEKETADMGVSKVASILRVVAWLMGILTIISGIAISFAAENILSFLIALIVGALEMLMFYALASILDYLAELTSIARNGFKYNESNK